MALGEDEQKTTSVKAATRSPQRPDATDKAVRTILAQERTARIAKTERLRLARIAHDATLVIEAPPEPKEKPKRAPRKAAVKAAPKVVKAVVTTP